MTSKPKWREKQTELRSADVKRMIRPHQANTHCLWFPLALLPCSWSKKIKRWPQGMRAKSHPCPSLPCFPHPCSVYRAGVFLIKRDKDYTPDSKASLSSHFPVFCLGFTGLLQLFWDVRTSSLLWVWKGLMFLYVGVFSSLEEESQPPALSSAIWKCSTSHSDISFLPP